MKGIFTKWWVWVLVVLFIVINLFVNDLREQDQQPVNRDVLEEGNINTH